MRYTKQEVVVMYKRLMKAVGENEYVYGEKSGWHLDYNSIYGGYLIEHVNKDVNTCSHPFSAMRRSAREMYLSMLMAAQAAEQMTYERMMRGVA